MISWAYADVAVLKEQKVIQVTSLKYVSGAGSWQWLQVNAGLSRNTYPADTVIVCNLALVVAYLMNHGESPSSAIPLITRSTYMASALYIGYFSGEFTGAYGYECKDWMVMPVM